MTPSLVNMLLAKIDCLSREIVFVKKNTSKCPFLRAQFWILGGAGGKTVNTRSTSGLLLRALGYNASNEVCGRLVPAKLSAQ